MNNAPKAKAKAALNPSMTQGDWKRIILLESIIEAMQEDQQVIQAAHHKLLESRLQEIAKLRCELKELQNSVTSTQTTSNMITVVLPPAWHHISSDRPRLFYPVQVAPETIRDLIDRMDEQCPGIKSRMVGNNGALLDGIHIMVDSTETRAMDKPLVGNETIAIAVATTTD